MVQLFSANSVTVDTATKSAAFQVALWEIVYETSGTLDAAVGAFSATSGTAGLIAQANTYLGNLAGNSAFLTFFESDGNPRSQNLVTEGVRPVVPEVPLPASGLLLVGALAGAGALAMRRKAA
jgi:hypothetical protein